MEKLILRSVMYGADKIPDSWFEKVPGGYYKTKEGKAAPAKEQSKRESKNNNGRHDSADSRKDRRSRRHSAGEGQHSPSPHDIKRDEGQRPFDPPRRRDSDRQRESYDGIEEVDGGNYSGDDRRRRRNHGSNRRRRSHEDERVYNYVNGPPPPRDDRRDERRYDDGAPYPERNNFGPTPRVQPDQYAQALGAAALTGTGIGVAAGASHPYNDPISPVTQSSQPVSIGRNGVAAGYVPYAHIYGGPASQTQQAPYSSSPHSSNGSAPLNDASRPPRPAVVPPGHYQQDPYAQDTGAYSPQAAYRSQDSGYHSRHDPRGDDRHNAYDEYGRPFPILPQPHSGHAVRNDYSPRRDSHAQEAPRSRPRTDTNESKRSKSSGGPLARERYIPPGYQVDSNTNSSNTTPIMKPVDPRIPLSAQFGMPERTDAEATSEPKDNLTAPVHTDDRPVATTQTSSPVAHPLWMAPPGQAATAATSQLDGPWTPTASGAIRRARG
ncbi:hypothetical protein LTR17_025170 [Elasticomyces elasticus]|nr:hypothetical protein LTR17_025170 [Elasticomyces elasticus]